MLTEWRALFALSNARCPCIISAPNEKRAIDFHSFICYPRHHASARSIRGNRALHLQQLLLFQECLLPKSALIRKLLRPRHCRRGGRTSWTRAVLRVRRSIDHIRLLVGVRSTDACFSAATLRLRVLLSPIHTLFRAFLALVCAESFLRAQFYSLPNPISSNASHCDSLAQGAIVMVKSIEIAIK